MRTRRNHFQKPSGRSGLSAHPIPAQGPQGLPGEGRGGRKVWGASPGQVEVRALGRTGCTHRKEIGLRDSNPCARGQEKDLDHNITTLFPNRQNCGFCSVSWNHRIMKYPQLEGANIESTPGPAQDSPSDFIVPDTGVQKLLELMEIFSLGSVSCLQLSWLPRNRTVPGESTGAVRRQGADGLSGWIQL